MNKKVEESSGMMVVLSQAGYTNMNLEATNKSKISVKNNSHTDA